MKKLSILPFFIFIYTHVFSQVIDLPIQIFNAPGANRPVLIYISGDGGMNKFSTSLMQDFSSKGYTAVALDARSYFWKKKDPQQAAKDIGSLINQYIGKDTHKECIIMGYSFGADVLPFIFNKLDKELQKKVAQLILLSPSPSTDFEIHVSDMFGFSNKRAVSTISEMNKLPKPFLLVFGNDEKEFPLDRVTVKNKQVLILPGGHHYDSDTNDLCNRLLQKIQ